MNERAFAPLELSPRALDTLGAGGGGPRELALLRAARRSRNLLLLRGLRERARAAARDGDAGGTALTRLEDGLVLLRAVQDHAPAEFDAVMDDPLTGAWLGCWARSGPLAPPAADAASLAAAAAYRAGLRFRVTVPVRSGAVVLPGLGLALPPGAVDTAEVTGDAAGCRVAGPGGEVRVPGRRPADGDGWFGVRRVRCEAGGAVWTFGLDSLDPYRTGGEPVAPRPLDSAEAARWEAELADAWAYLVERHPERAAETGRMVTTVVPLLGETPAVDEHGGWVSATLGDAVGLVALARCPGVRALAAGLVHEVQHSKLCALLDLADLLDAPPGTRCYSPWREEPRPPSALLQGAYAFMAVAGFWREEARSAPDAGGIAPAGGRAETSPWTRFAHRSAQTRAAVARLAASDWPTPDGRRFLTAMRRTLDSWAGPAPDARDAGRAVAAAAEHRVRWRLRHLAPPRRAVELLAAERAAGRPAPVAAAALLRAAGARPPDVWEVPAAPPPPGTARDAAELDALLRAPEAGGPEPWARLAATALLLADPRAAALAAMPELVRAVHAAAVPGARGPGRPGAGAAGSPLDLAHWLRPVIAACAAAPAA